MNGRGKTPAPALGATLGFALGLLSAMGRHVSPGTALARALLAAAIVGAAATLFALALPREAPEESEGTP